ncbi:MAG TPA: sigma-70 family RNA polymerase sigma factor [Thermoanaerobaculia bacterium]|nr:sigma-70 family RNA polymerase sigma factor [Thermoanaerobaculia bacterium]
MTMLAAGLMIPAPLLAEARTRSGNPRPMDEGRFEAFYRRTAGSLWSYLFRMTGDEAAADDLLQKTFFRFLRANPTLASEEHQRRWLFRTATNLAMDHFRETKRERKRAEQTTIADRPPSTEPREVLRHDMMKIFSELKPRERALLWLAHVEEADHEDIGEALGVKPHSVKVLLFRARKRLGELLTKKGLAPEVRR